MQIPLHGVEFRHGVGDGGPGGEDDAPVPGQLVQVAAFQEHIAGLLGVRGREASHIPHLGVEGQIFIVVRLVHEHPINAQLFKGHHIVLAVVGLQLFQPGLQRLPRVLQLLDCEPLALSPLDLLDALFDVVDLFFQHPLLPFRAHGYLLKLALADDNGVIVPGGDAGTELLAAGRLEVPLGRHKDVGGGVEPQELRGGLLGQVVRHHEDGLLAQAQALGLHGGGDHLEGLARAHLMGQERVAAVQHPGDGVELMGPKLNGRVDAAEGDVAPIIFPGPDAVHLLIVLLYQGLPPLRVPPEPVPEGVPNSLLFL